MLEDASIDGGNSVFLLAPGYDYSSPGGEITMSFGLWIVGYIVLIGGLAWGAHLAHVPQKWIIVGVICLAGIAIIHGVKATRQKDPAS